jgi:hypothetical protein
MDRCWVLLYAALAGGIIGGAMGGRDTGPLREAMPFAWGVIIALAVAVVFLLVDDLRRKL